LHKLSFDSSLANKDYISNFTDNSAAISGVIQTEKKLNKATIKELMVNFQNSFSGTRNAGKVPVLPEGMEFKQINRISPLDMDYINANKLNKADIAEIYGVPLSMLGTADLSYNNAESNGLMFSNYTIQPLLSMIEQELTDKLSKNNHKFEFRTNSIRLSSSQEKGQTLSLLNNTGIITANEARSFYNLPSIQGGDELKSEANKIGEAVQAPKNTEDTNVPANKDKKEQE